MPKSAEYCSIYKAVCLAFFLFIGIILLSVVSDAESLAYDGKEDILMKAPLNAERLAECRRKMGITKLEASKRMRLTQSGYLRYESGERRPTYPTIYEMANVLNTSAAYLLEKGGSQAVPRRTDRAGAACGPDRPSVGLHA